MFFLQPIANYTWVLKCHIDIAKVIFLEGCTGGNLDIIARSPLWQHGIDYRCGTGHGVGFVGGVHEGPQNLRTNNHAVFQPGMTITDEPGVYEEGKIGIRIENELVCKEWDTTEYGRFLCFEPITYCPIDTRPVKVELLDDAELTWLNNFHETVYRTLESSLNDREREWLKAACAPLFWKTVKARASRTGRAATMASPFMPFFRKVMALRPLPPRACRSKSKSRQRFM